MIRYYWLWISLAVGNARSERYNSMSLDATAGRHSRFCLPRMCTAMRTSINGRYVDNGAPCVSDPS
jgi:hypothetical protein